MICTYFIESSNFSLVFMIVIIHRVYALKLFLGIIHLDRNHGCLQDKSTVYPFELECYNLNPLVCRTISKEIFI